MLNVVQFTDLCRNGSRFKRFVFACCMPINAGRLKKKNDGWRVSRNASAGAHDPHNRYSKISFHCAHDDECAPARLEMKRKTLCCCLLTYGRLDLGYALHDVGKARKNSTRRLSVSLRGGDNRRSPPPHRSGSSIDELNPNYVGPSHSSTRHPLQLPLGTGLNDSPNLPFLTVGDLEKKHLSYATVHQHPDESHAKFTNFYRRVTLLQLARDFAGRLFCDSNSAFTMIAVLCVVVFTAWQIPSANPSLRRHWVVSRNNFKSGRLASLLLSALSHADPLHLLYNLAALYSLGPSVQRALERRARRPSPFASFPWPPSLTRNGHGATKVQLLIWPLMIGAALSGSLGFLILGGARGADGLGLSAVTMSLLAVHAEAYPDSILGMVLAGIIPVRLPARRMLQLALLWSVGGSLLDLRLPQRVSHSAHLGGLLFGIAYWRYGGILGHESWQRHNV
jgi:membrane associated rhomboid family serine protease